MSTWATGGIVFACVFGGALFGLLLRATLPQHHLTSESKDVVKLGMGLLATMAALVLSLLIASAKTSYDTHRTEVTQLAANVMLLDRIMAHYGAETKESRDLLRAAVARVVDEMWPQGASRRADLNPRAARAEVLYDKILGLSPQSEAQRLLRAEALSIATDLSRTRWLIFEQGGTTIPLPFLVLLIFWVTVIFASFGLFAPANATVVGTLFVCALSVSGAIVLILELDQPLQGLVQLSSGPLRSALANLGQ